jgi:hypothetical protein
MATACAKLNPMVAVLALAGTTTNGNPDRCCDRGFSLSASSALNYQPPLRFGDDTNEGSFLNRRAIKKPRFLVRGDTRLFSW